MTDIAKQLALGTAQFGLDYGVTNKSGQVSLREAGDIVDEARARGIDTIDTARAYGSSEQSLGTIGVSDFQVITKLPGIPENCRDVKGWIVSEIEDSIDKLGVPSLYGLLLHAPADLLSEHGQLLAATLQALQQQGLTGKIGVSVYSESELAACAGVMPLELVQVPLNIIDARVDHELLSELSSSGTEIHARSVFLQGLLLADPEEIDSKFEPWNSLFTAFSTWCAEQDVSPLQACITYVAHLDYVSKVVVGVETASQLRGILEGGAELSPLPGQLQCRDERLLNPVNWGSL